MGIVNCPPMQMVLVEADLFGGGNPVSTDDSFTFGDLIGMALLAAVIGGVVWAVGRAETLRHARNRRSARSRGWKYTAEDPEVALSVLPSVSPIRATDVAEGTVRGRKFAVYDYSFAPTRESRNTGRHLTVSSVEVGAGMPWVVLAPESVVTQAMAAFGGVDVKVESAEFNARWRVSTSDVRSAHALLTPRMIERFLQPDVEYRTIAFDHGAVITWEPGRLDLAGFKPPFDLLCDIAELVPRFLVKDDG